MYFLQQADHTRDEANCIPDACHVDSPVWMRKLVNHDRNGTKIEIFPNAMRHENVWSAHKTNDTRACASGVRAEKLEDGGHHALRTHSTSSVFGAHAEDDNDTIAKATANVMVQDNEG